ncbi:MAG: MFS transporter [Proteobacteria bacterium]|nr:MFS transporter [Pseudomonadota bacterium]
MPQIAADLAVSIGAASIIVSLYTLMHGAMQLVIGPVGDRLGKFRAVALACAASALIVAACGLAGSLTWLALARVASGATAAWIIPLGMAYIGDVIPYERRQQVLGSYLSGQIVGQIFGQAAGGVLGDILGWRAVFFVLAALFAAAAAALFYELAVNPRASAPARAEERSRGFAADYAAVFAAPWARVVITAVFLEAALMWGAFAYVGADLNARFALSFTAVGLCVGAFGLGGLAWRSLPPPRLRTVLGNRAYRHRSRRPWFLHAAQHAADQRNADGAAGARHRRRAFFARHLCRPDRGRRALGTDDRPHWRAAGISRRGDLLAGARPVVRLAAARAPVRDPDMTKRMVFRARGVTWCRARRARSRRAPAARPRREDCRRASS